MIRLRKRCTGGKVFVAFLICMALVLAVFGGRVLFGSMITPISNGQLLKYAEKYHMGTVYDRDETFIVCETDEGYLWDGLESIESFKDILGVDIADTGNSRMTVMGNCPWAYGAGDNRFSRYDLFHPNRDRVGGNVKLTFDKELQEYICQLIQTKGYENAYVVVSNWSTGEIYATYGEVLSVTMHPGSAIKPVIAAAALSVDPSLATYTYDCVKENHTFDTEEGPVKIHCINGKTHGKLDMGSGMAVSCNGYFVSLLKQVDKEKMLEELKKWGFDSCVSYDQFMYWDHTLINGAPEEIYYLQAGIGQANTFITPAGLNFCTNALLNKGTLVEPVWILAKQVSGEEDWISVQGEDAIRLCQEEVAGQVVDMMLKVTQSGTGTSFALPNFAAKTGTAQKSGANGMIGDRYTVWTTGGLNTPETPYSITVCLDDVTEDVGSKEAGALAQEILLKMLKGGVMDEETE